jgi:hypothetical protein
MIKSEIWHEIHSRFKLKETKKAIARTLGLSILTVRKVLRQAMPRPYQRAKPESGLRPCRWSEPSPPNCMPPPDHPWWLQRLNSPYARERIWSMAMAERFTLSRTGNIHVALTLTK